MPYLTKEEIKSLSSDDLKAKQIFIKRKDSRIAYKLISAEGRGMKGVVWKAINDIGEEVAIKLVPTRIYGDISLINEMVLAQKLNKQYFAEILFFGTIDGIDPFDKLDTYGIATKWINGEPFLDYVKNKLTSAEQFVIIAKQLFYALANLRANNLCHDDLHSGNILIELSVNDLNNETLENIKIIDTGTIKSPETRDALLKTLKEKIELFETTDIEPKEIKELRDLYNWKKPDDHFRVIACLIDAANGLAINYHRLDFWERRFFDQLEFFFRICTEESIERRVHAPDKAVSNLNAIEFKCKTEENEKEKYLRTPFDYPSSEMIRDDQEFSDLFSLECPWLEECKIVQALYIYGPRGCGKSSVLRWLSFKTHLSDPNRSFEDIREIGIYISCSVELRSRFWLLDEDAIKNLKVISIRFFNLLLLEELFDTLSKMAKVQQDEKFNFGFTQDKLSEFTKWAINRIEANKNQLRLEGQGYFDYLRLYVRKLKWDTWSDIQNGLEKGGNADPSLASDVSKELGEYFEYFKSRHITFLIDDYSNQRIPKSLQLKLNQTISFAKNDVPLFKVSSEYHGVELEGIQEGREVHQINIGEKYTSLDSNGEKFIEDIINKRLKKTKKPFKSTIAEILDRSAYEGGNMAVAIANETTGNKFYYHGIDCIHQLCSGDVALALDVVKRIFDAGRVNYNTVEKVPKKIQHKVIQQFAQEEVRHLKYIVPDGDKVYDIIVYLGALAHAYVKTKKSGRKEKSKAGIPVCKTSIDIRDEILTELEQKAKGTDELKRLVTLYGTLTSKAILFSLNHSRSRISGSIEKLQIRRIYLPAFKAPFKRDHPIKIDTLDELIFFLTNPENFCKNELKKSRYNENQLEMAIKESLAKPHSKL